MMRVVVDVNVMVSRFLTPGGHGYQVLQAALLKNKYVLVTSEEIALELEDVVSRKRLQKFFTPQDHEDISYFCSRLRRLDAFISVPTPESFKAVPTDSNDDKIIWCAVQGKADYIVSGDKRDLLSLGEYQGIRIVSPKTFLEIIDAS